MATTFTWIGGQGTLDPNDASFPAHWSPAGPPGDGDAAIVGAGATVDLVNTSLSPANLQGNAVSLTGDAVLNFSFATFDPGTTFVQVGAGLTDTMNAGGTVDNQGILAASSA